MKSKGFDNCTFKTRSLSSRRAWIEMLLSTPRSCAKVVALLTEGVD